MIFLGGVQKPEEDLVAEPVRNQSVPIIMPLESGCQMADSLTKHKSKIEVSIDICNV